MIHHRQRLWFQLEPGDHLARVHSEPNDLERDLAFYRFQLLGRRDNAEASRASWSGSVSIGSWMGSPDSAAAAGRFRQNRTSFSISFTRCSMAGRRIFVVRMRPNPSQQNDATAVP